jgi:hypothetical protein
VIIISSLTVVTLQITGTLNTPMIYHSDKTKAELLGSWLKQWHLLEEEECHFIETGHQT